MCVILGLTPVVWFANTLSARKRLIAGQWTERIGDPERVHPSMFEPVHGSAPDIAGKGIANPIGQIWSAAMMLDHLGETEAGKVVLRAIERVLTSPKAPLTPDLGGNATTVNLGSAITDAVSSS